jgi:RNA polymerase sigma factor (sigma-70 family)
MIRIAKLTDRQEQIFRLRFEYMKKPTEIGRQLGIDSSTVREHLKAANQKLRKLGSPRTFTQS